jgi:hypothetical protein
MRGAPDEQRRLAALLIGSEVDDRLDQAGHTERDGGCGVTGEGVGLQPGAGEIVGAIGGEVVLAGVVAVEHQGVVAGVAVDGVAGVAGIPAEAVIATSKRRAVLATAAVDLVVTGAAGEHVVAIAAARNIITRTTIDR